MRLVRPAIAGSVSPAELDISNRRRADEASLRLAGDAGIAGLPSPPCDVETDVPQIGILIEGITATATG